MRQRVLIANRGEIAIRAIRACRKLGLECVAVYSAADRAAPHAWLADQAICVGPPSSQLSYLNVNALLHVADATNCTMVYPGYGFLAENAAFAEQCVQAGLCFVGPTPDCIEMMGDKARARRTAIELNVPVVPGSSGAFTAAAEALKSADEVGYPMLLKASAGGGGRGMRVVENQSSFTALFEQASREAGDAFGDPSIYLERYFPAVRHIEVQVFGDAQGRVRHLGERDCTTQRRHQKLVEESPSPALTEGERTGLQDAAVKLAESVGYQGAGTVEFIFDEASRAYFFIEMNTRIQVEHPVTEMCIGHDLIVEQLRVAMGERLSIPDDRAWPRGHAVEFRINAEDAARKFMPSPGRVRSWRPPQGVGVRVDSYVYEGLEIQPYYDSMIAKLIVHGPDRPAALERARNALDSFSIEGVQTTVPFHRALLDDPDFIANKICTRWVENTFLGRLT
ncbi:MAG: acetyl-CoA carboxylase biotin carboxylase subunit [Hyphomicrobiaceae bacterium]